MSEPADFALAAAVLTDRGTTRENNEDSCALWLDGGATGLVAIADGVSQAEAGEVASSKAVEVVMREYQETDPRLAPGMRLQRAVQRANIEVHDMAMIVPELRGMATTVTAFVVHRAELTAAHVGDCRLYRVRNGVMTQLTKDHTVAAERTRMGLLSEARAKWHPGRSTLTRSLGRDLIVALDRITTRLQQGDVLVCCSDGLYNVMTDAEIAALAARAPPAEACAALIAAANDRGTDDNLTAAVLQIVGPVPAPDPRPGLAARLLRLVGGSR